MSLVRKSRGSKFCRLFNLRALLLGVDARIQQLPDDNVFLAKLATYAGTFMLKGAAHYLRQFHPDLQDRAHSHSGPSFDRGWQRQTH